MAKKNTFFRVLFALFVLATLVLIWLGFTNKSSDFLAGTLGGVQLAVFIAVLIKFVKWIKKGRSEIMDKKLSEVFDSVSNDQLSEGLRSIRMYLDVIIHIIIISLVIDSAIHNLVAVLFGYFAIASLIISIEFGLRCFKPKLETTDDAERPAPPPSTDDVVPPVDPDPQDQ